jgi:hypothetical protein
MAFDAEVAELEDTDGEPEPDDELDTRPSLVTSLGGSYLRMR